MAYGDYNGPDKADKGKEGGSCNRTLCQCSPAKWYNHGSYAWYCDDCAFAIGHDPMNFAHWLRDFEPTCGHPQFETRAEMDARQAPPPAQSSRGIIDRFEATYPELYWHVAKGKISAGEPLYGAAIFTDGNTEMGHGESDESAEEAFRIAVDDAGLSLKSEGSADGR